MRPRAPARGRPPCDVDLEAARLRELPSPAPVVISLLRAQLRGVDLLPAGRRSSTGASERSTRRLRREGPSTSTKRLGGEPGELREVVAGRGAALDERRLDLTSFIVLDEHVGERRVLAPDEREHAQPVPAAHAHRKRADQPAAAVRDLDGQLAVRAVVPPPLQQPGVEQERARPPLSSGRGGPIRPRRARRTRSRSRSSRGSARPELLQLPH